MRIFLVGFMGCGKTTLGRKLASRLSVPFTDLDKVFEEVTGKTVPLYFKEFGEDAFRKAERDVLQTSDFPDDVVIATGGGAPCYYNNMDWMNANGFTVYISLSPVALAKRLETAEEERPVLRDHKGTALVEFIAEKLKEREPFYKQAHLIAEGISLSAEKLASAIALHQLR